MGKLLVCGRFTNKAKSKDIEKEFKVGRKNANLFEPRYNIAPSQMIDVVFEPESERILSQLKWGLVPSWSKDAATSKGLINA
jgi:putative SOS response-associated peptidase YedK